MRSTSDLASLASTIDPGQDHANHYYVEYDFINGLGYDIYHSPEKRNLSIILRNKKSQDNSEMFISNTMSITFQGVDIEWISAAGYAHTWVLIKFKSNIYLSITESLHIFTCPFEIVQGHYSYFFKNRPIYEDYKGNFYLCGAHEISSISKSKFKKENLKIKDLWLPDLIYFTKTDLLEVALNRPIPEVTQSQLYRFTDSTSKLFLEK